MKNGKRARLEGVARMEHLNERQALRARVRRARMARLRAKGWTLERIGKRFGGITKQRVRAILAREEAA